MITVVQNSDHQLEGVSITFLGSPMYKIDSKCFCVITIIITIFKIGSSTMTTIKNKLINMLDLSPTIKMSFNKSFEQIIY